MKRTILRATILAAALTWALGLALAPAHASTTVSLSGVAQCNNSSCDSTSSLKTDGTQTAQGLIRVTASVSAGLVDSTPKWIRVIASDEGSSSYTCIAQWSTSSKNVSKTVTWDTTEFPSQSASGCPSDSGASYGELTHNGTLHIKAQTSNNSTTYTSGTATILLNNAPSAPVWASNPSASGAAQRHPVVTLSWNADPEPDVLEYHFVRHFSGDPNGPAAEFAVSATNPGAQGCSGSNGVYTCRDASFSSTGFGGTYDYWLVAYRSSPAGADKCSDVSGGANCIQSPLSQQRSVSMTEPAPSPSGSPSSGSTAAPGGTHVVGSRPTGVTPSATGSEHTSSTSTPQVLGSTVNREQFCFTCGSYGKTLPYGNNIGGSLPGDGSSGVPSVNGRNPILAAGPQLATGTGGADPKQLWTSLAAGMVLLLTAAHVARVLRATAH